jgi:undecaprenyl-diphosphatase
MPITLLQIVILGLVQGAAELLPVSSSAHVIVAERLMGIDPVSPEATFILVMLHTGTMLAVVAYFWRAWSRSYFSSAARFWVVLRQVILATAATGVVGLLLKKAIDRASASVGGTGEVEELFGKLPLIAAGLAAAGILIAIAGRRRAPSDSAEDIGSRSAAWIGLVQGLCLPFRGFSRSGATISVALMAGVDRRRAEEFSFALAVVLTPVVVAMEFLRLLRARAAETEPHHLIHLVGPGAFGMLCSFAAGLLALRWLSRWLESGRWRLFGWYCLAAAAVVVALSQAGI